MSPDEKKIYSKIDFFENLTGEIEEDKVTGFGDVGIRIRRLREEKGLSIEELANLTGFEPGLLSKIENNEVKPQLGTMIKLSKALDSAFGRIVSGVGTSLYSITRRSEQKVVKRSTTSTGKQKAYTYKSLAPEVKGRHMEALIVQLDKVSEEEISVHEGEEFIYVLSGTVLLKIGEERFELEPGDSAYYLSTTPHFITAKEERATIVAVLYGG